MLLSTKGDYGVRALIDLAKHVGEGPVQRAEIARSTLRLVGVPPLHAERDGT